MKEIKIALLGFGTVASGVYDILQTNPFSSKLGFKVSIAKILVRDITKYDEALKPLLTTDYQAILNDEQITVVAELTGAKSVAKDYIIRALEAKKSVVTANKYLVARHYQEFLDTAKKNHVYFYYEAAVGGGIPLILAFNQGLIANRIEGFYGILNGTCNYILTQMTQHGMSYQKALVQAKQLGYAEADESGDVLGYDSLNKLLILARLAYGQSFDVESIYCRGITDISVEDIENATKNDCVIKLLVVAEQKSEGLCLAVYPALVPKHELLAQVDMAYNALLIKGDAVGDVMLYGQGAGSLPTASAVISDIVAVALNCENNLVKENTAKKPLLDFEKLDIRFKPV